MKLCSCGTKYKCITCRNTEEETKIDELKVYTGRGAIEALLEGKTLKTYDLTYKMNMNGKELLVDFGKGKGWEPAQENFNTIMANEFTEVATPQVGDWVKTCGYTGQITKVDETCMYARWSNIPHMETPIFLSHTWEILSPEQVSDYKREQAFTKVGRKPDEFKESDIAYVEALGVMAVVVSHNNDQEVRLHKINKREGLTAKPHQLTPISFVEQQVDLS